MSTFDEPTEGERACCSVRFYVRQSFLFFGRTRKLPEPANGQSVGYYYQNSECTLTVFHYHKLKGIPAVMLKLLLTLLSNKQLHALAYILTALGPNKSLTLATSCFRLFAQLPKSKIFSCLSLLLRPQYFQDAITLLLLTLFSPSARRHIYSPRR